MHRTLITILIAAVALGAPAAALAATKHYTGSTDQGLRLSFDYGSKKVTNFKARVRCTGKKATTFSFSNPIPVNSKGRFSVHQAGPSIDGRISGSSAKGTLILPGCDADANTVNFTAHHG